MVQYSTIVFKECYSLLIVAHTFKKADVLDQNSVSPSEWLDCNDPHTKNYSKSVPL